MSKLVEKIAQFKGKQEKITKMNQDLQNEIANYKAEFKDTFGIADGDQANLLELIETIGKVVEMKCLIIATE